MFKEKLFEVAWKKSKQLHRGLIVEMLRKK